MFEPDASLDMEPPVASPLVVYEQVRWSSAGAVEREP